MRRSVWEVAAETLREIGVLWAVFFMLDDRMNGGSHFPPWVKGLVLIVSAIMIVFGIWVESRPRESDRA